MYVYITHEQINRTNKSNRTNIQVPHCAEVSRHENRHVLRIVGEAAIPFDVSEGDKKRVASSNNIRISSWTHVSTDQAADILGAPKTSEIGKPMVFESKHNYTQRDNKKQRAE